MAKKPRIVCIGKLPKGPPELLAALHAVGDVSEVRSAAEAVFLLEQDDSVPMPARGGAFEADPHAGQPSWSERILEDLPDGVVLIDDRNVISWANRRFQELCPAEVVIGAEFHAVLGKPEILGPDFCPFHTALATREPSSTRLRIGEKHYFQLYACPVRNGHEATNHLVVVVRDITTEVQQQQTLQAIYEAGTSLTDLKVEELSQMSVDDRIDLLKSNILHYTQHLLRFQVCEIRLLEQRTGRLVPLLAEGMEPAAAERELYAKPQDNGVTGFVAATGQSYLCEDTAEDPLYLRGLAAARSSLTVPLVLHGQVIGTFNVESPEPRAFSQNDLQFLELFAADVSLALNTLELLAAQQATALQQGVDAIHGAVALPIDRILNEAVHLSESYIGHTPDATEHLRNILRYARDIRELIRNVGKDLAPEDAVPAGVLAVAPEGRRFPDVRVLVVDEDEAMLRDAHAILEKHGCVVETARTGSQAVFMVRSGLAEGPYEVIIADVRLPDMTGYELLVQLKQQQPRVPLVLMQGFGHDPGHSIVKARQEGLPAKAVLYKPFRVNQLLDVIATILECQ